MPSDDERPRGSIARKLSRKRRNPNLTGGGISQSMHLPARGQTPASDDDDQADVSAPGQNMPFNMNQSIFQMLAAARSTVRLNSRFDEDSEYSDDDDDDDSLSSDRVGRPLSNERSGHARGYSISRLEAIEESKRGDSEGEEDVGDLDSSRGPAPVMSQMLEAQAQMNTANLAEAAQEQEMTMFGICKEADQDEKKSSDLARRLMEIFNLPEMEQVVAEYPCWLLKSVLLQGYMYITTGHICYYAYLPRKTEVIAKSGFLSKRGKSNVKFTRYWFILKGDVLSYFPDPKDLYFPNGHIDLRYGIQASLVDNKGKDPTALTLTTDKRKYYFRADSATSAKEWVKALQKVIFRTHNEGDSVKISIPVENVIDVDESPVLGFADTIKLKAVDNDDTFAIDEYFFSFFSFENDALKVLQSVTEDSSASRIPEHVFDGSEPASPAISGQEFSVTTRPLRENIRATLSPRPLSRSGTVSPRPSGENSRSSFDLGARRSVDLSKERLKRSTEPARHSIDSSRSNVRTPFFSPRSTPPASKESLPADLSLTESADTLQISSDDEGNQSASHILSRSDVFRSPTMKKLHRRSGSKSAKSEKKKSKAKSPTPLEHHVSRRRTTGGAKMSKERERERAYESDSEAETEQRGLGSPTLNDLAKVGTFPLQRAAGWADWMRRRSKKMSGLLASESMGYIEKVSDMWTGGRKHYREPKSAASGEDVQDAEDEDDIAQEHGDRFRAHFALPEHDRLIAVYFAHLHRVFPLYGKIYVSTRSFCFRSILPGTKTKMIVPLKDIENVDKEKGFRFGYSGLVVTIRGYPEVFFEFGQVAARDDCATTLLSLNDVKHYPADGMVSKQEYNDAEAAKQEYQMLQDARQEGYSEHQIKLPTHTEGSGMSEQPPIVFDDPHGSILNFKPTEPMNITCLTIGSRGDVQPFVALCLGLMKDGHKCKIATHAEFRGFVEDYGIEFAEVAGDPGVLMDICVQHGMFTLDFMKEVNGKMRAWLDELLETAWNACQGSDLLIESPSAMAGIHIAEALAIPYFRAFTMPWTRTRAYPHAFAVPEHKMGGAYNYFTYVLIDNVFWTATATQINKWRRRMLKLPRTSLDKLQPNEVPFLYNFSPHVVAPPLDYSEWIRVTGYWFLDQTTPDFKPPEDLARFIKKAREDGKKIVYVGFGSVTVGDSVSMTKTVVEAVQRADVRCILSKGWSDRMHKKDVVEIPMPAEIHQIQSCPHDWLFNQIDAAVHHGGAGTTGASLRAGIPTIIKPFFGDQFFFGNRVKDLGVGICLKKLATNSFAKALTEATSNERMIQKAKILGQEIRNENGVETAIQCLYREMDRARTLIKKPNAEPPDDSEESWTMVDERDMGQSKKTGK